MRLPTEVKRRLFTYCRIYYLLGYSCIQNLSKQNTDDSGHLQCYAVYSGKQLQPFRRIVMPIMIKKPLQTIHQSTRRNIPADLNLQQNSCENLKSRK